MDFTNTLYIIGLSLIVHSAFACLKSRCGREFKEGCARLASASFM